MAPRGQLARRGEPGELRESGVGLRHGIEGEPDEEQSARGQDTERETVRTDDGDGPPPGCVGLECQVVNCAKKGLPPTSISGTVYAPNGTLALTSRVQPVIRLSASRSMPDTP